LGVQTFVFVADIDFHEAEAAALHGYFTLESITTAFQQVLQPMFQQVNEIPDDTTNEMYWWRDFQLQLGSAIAPTVAFSQMNPQEGSMARAYNEFLSVIGKPLGMRGNTLTYAD
jgi:hypothetical protein